MRSPRARVPAAASALFIVMVLAIPVMGTFDMLQSFQSGMGATYLEHVRAGGERIGTRFLYLREVLLLSVSGIVFVWLCLVGQPIPRMRGVAALFAAAGVSLGLSFALYPGIVAVAGIRQFTYPVLILVLYFISRESGRTESLFAWAVAAVVAVQVVVAGVQLAQFEAAGYGALLGARVYGTFNNPNTLGVVCVSAIFIVLFMGDLPRWVVACIVVLAVLGETLLLRKTWQE